MISKVSKINKKKGIEIAADLLYEGKTRKEILQIFVESYKLSESAVDKWLKEARTIVLDRQQQEEAIRAKENEALIKESAKRLNISRERVLEEYAKVAFGDIREVLKDDGTLKEASEWPAEAAGSIAGIESMEEKGKGGASLGTIRKIKVYNKVAALDSICKVLGYNAPTKVSPTDPSGAALPAKKHVFIINGVEIEFD